MPALLIGLLGSPHCLGMCGGLAALAGQSTDHPRSPVFIVTLHGARLASYTLLGVLAGLLGHPLKFSPELLIVARLLAGGMLIAMGLYVAGWWNGLRHLEALGGRFWQRLTRGRNHVSSPVLLGLSWGLLPCGLVYSTLMWSMATGDPLKSPLIMLLFGLGTLPAMLTTSWFSVHVRRFMSRKRVRLGGALMLIFAGVWTLIYPLGG